jgi:hypothetical protein
MPSKERFVKHPWNEEYFVHARVGYLLLKTLLNTITGCNFLTGTSINAFDNNPILFADAENPFYLKKSFLTDL